tara:strand:+ start:760 stop:945 length:186 start_codon:yes stop_codon:yes gene_type:complete
LNKSFIIYLIDAKSKQRCSGKFHQGTYHLSDDWRDGFGSGYAINLENNLENNLVIYWLVIW